jgi:hypothetical protein
MVEVARALNDLDVVEFVDFERPIALDQNAACDPNNQTKCNVPSGGCMPGNINCNPDPGGANPETACADVVCCQLIGDLIPYCTDPDQPQGWDLLCATYANMICDQTIYDGSGSLPPADRYDPCFTDGLGAPNPIFTSIAPALSGGCFESHEGRGCNIPGCCFAICNIDPTCCTVNWDAGCVALTGSAALAAACVINPDPGPSPDFKGDVITNPNFGVPGEPPLIATNWQTYRVVWPSQGDFGVPPYPAGVVFPNLGWARRRLRPAGHRGAADPVLQSLPSGHRAESQRPDGSGRHHRVLGIHQSRGIHHGPGQRPAHSAQGHPRAGPNADPDRGRRERARARHRDARHLRVGRQRLRRHRHRT